MNVSMTRKSMKSQKNTDPTEYVVVSNFSPQKNKKKADVKKVDLAKVINLPKTREKDVADLPDIGAIRIEVVEAKL